MAGKIPLLLFSLITLLAAVNNNSTILYILYIVFQLILALFIVILYSVKCKEFQRAFELEMTKKERRQELKSATQLSSGIPYKPGSGYPYLNNTSSSETSKPNSDNVDSNRRSKIYNVRNSDSDCSEDDPLMRKTRKANKKLRSMKYPADPDKTSQSGMGQYTITANTVSNSYSDSESRRPKIKWRDQKLEKTSHESNSLKIVSKGSNIPDIIPSIEHLDEAAADTAELEKKELLNSRNSLRGTSSMKRQKSILKNKSVEQLSVTNGDCQLNTLNSNNSQTTNSNSNDNHATQYIITV